MAKGDAESLSPVATPPNREPTSETTRNTPFLRTTHAPFRFMHPTHLEDVREIPDRVKWHSRASRKHRYVAKPTKVYHHADGLVARGDAEKVVTGDEGKKEIQLRVHHRFSRLKPNLAWDISFWVAASFVWGSAAWVGADSLSFNISICLHYARSLLLHLSISPSMSCDKIDYQRFPTVPSSTPRRFQPAKPSSSVGVCGRCGLRNRCISHVR